MTTGNPQAESERIRAELAATPGALRCGIKGCPTITQGGGKGLGMHRRVVHARDTYLTTGGGK